MTDDHDLQARMAELARDLQAQKDPEKTLQHVVEAAVELVPGCDSATITLASSRGDIKTSASTSTEAGRAGDLQVQLSEGPCLDAAWQQQIVAVPDLLTEGRWTTWAPRAVEELGFRSMVCLQLFTHDDKVGSLNLFAMEPQAFSDDDIDQGVAIAAQASVAVVQAEEIAGLGLALSNRTVIGQATGLLMGYYGLSDDQAFNLLRRLSSERNTKISALAHTMVDNHNRDREQPQIGRHQ